MKSIYIFSLAPQHTTFCVVRRNTAFFMHCQTGDFSAKTGEFLYGILILFVGIRLDLPKCCERKRTPDSGGVAADFGRQKARCHGDCGGGQGALSSVNFRQFRSSVPHSKSGSLHFSRGFELHRFSQHGAESNLICLQRYFLFCSLNS